MQVKYLRRGKVNTGIVIGLSAMALLLMLALCGGGGGYYYYYVTTEQAENVDKAIFAKAVDGMAYSMKEYHAGHLSDMHALSMLMMDWDVYETVGNSGGVNAVEQARFRIKLSENVRRIAGREFNNSNDFEVSKNHNVMQEVIDKGLLSETWLEKAEKDWHRLRKL